MKYTKNFLAILIAFVPFSASAASVYQGCAAPITKSGNHTFYIDPIGGNDSGDGSSAKPWKSLSYVLSSTSKLVSTQGHTSGYIKGTDTALHPVNPTGPIKAGDHILLKSGNHGSLILLNMYNTDFITIAAAPGQTPTISRLAVISSAKWVFQGIRFQGMASTATGATAASPSNLGLVTAGRGDWEGPTSDIVFTGNSLSTSDSTVGWTNYDWINKPYAVAFWSTGPCISFTGNHVYNVQGGLSIAGAKTLVEDNVIEKFSNDAINITASNLLIKNNTIKGGVNTLADPYHADGIQGWSVVSNGVTATNTNVVIDGNILTKTGDPKVTYMQGISIFDGKWSGLVIQNNVVDVNVWNAIAVYGAQNSRIINNTVIAADPAAEPSWIQVRAGKDGTASKGVVVRNNIATQYLIGDSNTAFDHNIAASRITMPVGGKSTAFTSGSVGSANAVLPSVLNGFMTLNTSAGTFDMRLRPTSVAVGFGTLASAPVLDVLGETRTAPVDAGAYVH